MVESREFHFYCGGEETGSKCLPTNLVGYLQIFVPLLMGCVNVSSCLLSVSQYFKKLYLPIKKFAKLFFLQYLSYVSS